MVFKKLLGIGLSVGLTVTIVGCANDEESVTNKEDEVQQENQTNTDQEDTAAIVNGENITVAEVDEAIEQVKPMYEQQGIDLENDEKTLAQLREVVLDQLINTKLLTQAAQETGYDPSEKEINQSLETITGQYESEEQLNQALESNNMSIETLKEDIKKDIIMNKYIADHTTEVSITEEEIRQTYDQFKQQNPEVPAYDEVKEQIAADLSNQKQQEQVGELVQQLRDESEIEVLI